GAGAGAGAGAGSGADAGAGNDTGFDNDGVDFSDEGLDSDQFDGDGDAKYQHKKDIKQFHSYLRSLELKHTGSGDENFSESYYIYLEDLKYVRGEISSSTIEEFKEHQEIFGELNIVGKQNDFVTTAMKGLRVFHSQFIIPNVYAQSVVSADEKPSNWGTIKNTVTSLILPVTGIIGMLIPQLAGTVIKGLNTPAIRIALFGGVSALAFLTEIPIAIEKKKVKKRIAQYQAIIDDLSKLGGNNMVEGTTKEQHSRSIDPGLSGAGTSASKAYCVDDGLDVDENCDCVTSDSCATVSMPKSSFTGFEMPDLAMSTINGTEDFVDDLGSGNLSGANTTGSNLGKNALRARKGVADTADKVLGDLTGGAQNYKSATDSFIAGMQAKVKRAAASSGSGGLGGYKFGSLLPDDDGKIDAKKAVENMKKAAENIKGKTSGSAGTGGSGGLDFNFGGGSPSKANNFKLKKLSEKDHLKGLKMKVNDIQSSDRNLFEAIHIRYLNSYPKLLEETK
ncbi:MAG: hypothetical protein HOE90_19100, partial [Bacteriovoracaceae bacterium]|nr:hypothetical protein [Bacteriovoracaceae bacterium]